MISKKARKRKSHILYNATCDFSKTGSLSHFQIKIIRQLVLIASYRRLSSHHTTIEKIKLDKLHLYRIKPKKLSDTKKKDLVFSWWRVFCWQL